MEGEQFISQGAENLRMRSLEEKQRIIKERLLLIGNNLIELKEGFSAELLEIKKEVETIKQNMTRLISFLETASEEMNKFAKKEDLELFAKKIKLSI